jgi:parvulin-like peptidyl-prolyl isomerase
MKLLFIAAVLGAALSTELALAQVASHAPTPLKTLTDTNLAPPASASPNSSMQVSGRPVVRINGTELTDRDLLREMLAIFPYARQHNGFPKGEEAKIREGALRMIEFEELVYQEAERRKMTVPAAKLQRAEADYRSQFPTQEEFDKYLKTEMQGSTQLLRRQIRRSLLVDALLKTEVEDKSKVTLAEARAYYEKNPKLFQHNETFSIQTISIMPPDNASNDVKKEARKRAEDALRQAKATKSYQEFGLLAEKLSEDDFHVNMGDHKAVERDKLPPEVVKAALGMKPEAVSDLLQLGSYYTFFRLNAHTPAGKVPLEAVKDRLRKDMEKERYERLRAGLDKKLRQNAKVQEL